MTVSQTEWGKRGKEAAPEETVKKIKKIINDLGYDIIYEGNANQSLEDCYSCRLHLDKGMEAIASNGKGMTSELSMASAYGELIERIQNRTFTAIRPRRDDEHYEELCLKNTPLYDPLTKENEPECMTKLILRIAESVTRHSVFMSDEDYVRDLISKLSYPALGNKISTTPFYSLKDDKIVYIPDTVYTFTVSNGMAAGNTYEEAMIEGISELLERHSQSIIMDGKVIPPQIPRDYIAKFPHILKVVDDIEASGRYKVRLLDCSLGMKLPVVCGVIIDTVRGTFGVKFGAQPNAAIAMERVFTEAMQGCALEEFSKRSYPDIGISASERRRDKWNNMKISFGSAPSQLLMDEATYDFTPFDDVTGLTNSEIMMSLIRLMEGLGSDIYVRDSGYLGFPSVDIYAAGISELKPLDVLELKVNILHDKVGNLFRNIGALSDEEVEDIRIFASVRMGSMLEDDIGSISQLYFRDPMPVRGAEAEFLYAACCYRLGDVKKAAEMFCSIAKALEGTELVENDTKLYAMAVYYYVASLSDGIKEQQAFDLAYNLCGQSALKVREQFCDKMAVLGKLYPVCGNKPALEITEGDSRYREARDFHKLLIDKENENPMKIETMREIFKKLHE